MQIVVRSVALAAKTTTDPKLVEAFTVIDGAKLAGYTADMLDALATHCGIARKGHDGARYVKVATSTAERLIDEAIADVGFRAAVKRAWAVLAGVQ